MRTCICQANWYAEPGLGEPYSCPRHLAQTPVASPIGFGSCPPQGAVAGTPSACGDLLQPHRGSLGGGGSGHPKERSARTAPRARWAWVIPVFGAIVVALCSWAAYNIAADVVLPIRPTRAPVSRPRSLEWQIGLALAVLLWGISWIALAATLSALAVSSVAVMRSVSSDMGRYLGRSTAWKSIAATVLAATALALVIQATGFDFGPPHVLDLLERIVQRRRPTLGVLTGLTNGLTLLAVMLLVAAYAWVGYMLRATPRGSRALPWLEICARRQRRLLYAGALALIAGAIEVQCLYGACAAVLNIPSPALATTPPAKSAAQVQSEQLGALALGLGGIVGAAFTLLLTVLYLPGAVLVHRLAERAATPNGHATTAATSRQLLQAHGLESTSPIQPLKRVLAAVGPLLATILTASILETIKHLVG